MAKEEERRSVGLLLLRVLAGKTSAREAIQAIEQRRTRDESIIRALHMLYHYRDDDDARDEDPAYAALQTKAMKDMADRLSEGLPLTREHGYW